VARRRDRLEALAAEIDQAGGTALAVDADITDRTQAEAAVQQTVYDSEGWTPCWRCGSPTRTGCASASWRCRRIIRSAAMTDRRGARCRRGAQVEIEEYFSEATSGDYDHLLQATMCWVDWP
jgi:NAD(P)-dependent dehydrogenase (short-subunit alcohol dehydrogenase family)